VSSEVVPGVMGGIRTQLWASGGGGQSAAIAALIVQGKFRPDLAVIVDTEREQSTTWAYMDEVISPALATVGVTLHRVKKSEFATVDLYGGKEKNDLLLPVFTNQSGEIGKLPTFCSNEWKTRVVRRWATQQGVVKADVWIGFSTDEMGRCKPSKGKWRDRYVLLEEKLNRQECEALVASMGWPKAPRSSCWNCPNHTQEEWLDIRDNKPADWRKAVAFDKFIRIRDANAFLHADCVPLDEADLSEANGVLFNHCDTGLCFV
jgi:hypothetical protein